MRKVICFLILSASLCSALTLFAAAPSVPPLNVALKPKQPNWRAEIAEKYPHGSPKTVLYYEPRVGEEEVPVKQMTLYPNGAIQTELDLIVLVEKDPETSEEKKTYQPHGFRVDLNEAGEVVQAFSYEKGVLQGEGRTFYPKGKVQSSFSFEKGQLNGKLQSFYENGTPKEEASYINGIMDGEYIQYFEGGLRSSLVPYREGVIHGVLSEWHPNGHLKAQRQFLDGQLHGNGKTPAVIVYDEDRNVVEMFDFREGQPVGTHFSYYKNGKEAHRVAYQQGKRHGKEQFFAEDGTLLGEGLFTQGKAVGRHWRNHPDGGIAYVAEFNEEGVLQAPIVEYGEEEQKIREFFVIDDQFEGEAREWHPGGVIKAEYQYKKGQYDGEQKEYYPSGQVKTLTHYKEGLRDGIHEQWHENGVLSCRGSFALGKKNGQIAEWHPDGTAKIDSYYELDVPQGIHSEWYENGHLKFRVEFASGIKEGWQREWSDQGNLMAEAFYQKGELHGTLLTWWNKEQIKSRMNYKQGKREGEHAWYTEDGQLARIAHFSDDQPDGELKAWYPSGALQLSQNYRKGLSIGEHVEYYLRSKPEQKDSERICRLIQYDDLGRLHGEERSYYPDGHLQSLISYQHGSLHGLKQFWGPKKDLIEEATYSQGKLEGRYFQKLPDLKEIVFHYHESFKQGLHEMYYPPNEKGEKIRALQAYFEKDRLEGIVTEYAQDSAKVAETPYIAGMKEGLAHIYSPDGSLAATVNFHADQKDGLITQYFPDGAVFRETPYINDLRSGEEKTFFDNGKLASSAEYENDKLHGLSQTWNRDQVLVFEAEYFEGMRHGKFNKYYDDGRPLLEQFFAYDQLHGKKCKYDEAGEMTVSYYEEGHAVKMRG